MAARITIVVLLLLQCSTALGQHSKLLPDYSDHPCIRNCKDEADPFECRYHFVAESYQTMSKACYRCANGNTTDCLRDHCVTADGFSRNIKTINRMIPGPTIQVCEGDTIVVDMENYFSMMEGVTIHWHGLLQRYTPFMDGVGMITQCPIQPYTTFQYKFVAMDPGTHFWHAHTGLQRGDGLFGSLIVRQAPEREPHIGSYDFDLPEHVIIINEWQNKPLLEIFTAKFHSNGEEHADAILINGRSHDPTGGLVLPRPVFEVLPGRRYRFRVISAGSLFCPMVVSVDDHNLTLIASDGRAFEPFVVQSFDMYSAERYDFVLSADRPVGDYWLRVTGLGFCDDNNLTAEAVIRYRSPDLLTGPRPEPPKTKAPTLTGVLFNAIKPDDSGPLGDARDQIVAMDALAPDDRTMTGTPDHQFILSLEMRDVDNTHFFDPDLYPANTGPYPTVRSAQINRITTSLGPVPLLTQMDEIPEEAFCNETSLGTRCQTEWCECVHRLRVTQGELVEIVFLSPSGQGYLHPLHVHGHSFRVVAMERVDTILSPELFREMDARGEVARKLSRAPFKDTVAVPNSGYTIVRFIADKPGVWFTHCHLSFHAEIGMSLVLEVLGEDGKLPPRPENFPTCGPFQMPTPVESKYSADKNEASDLNNNLLSTGSKDEFLSRDPDDISGKAVTPQWVVPLVASLWTIIAVLAVVSIVLWRKMARMNRREYLYTFPTYRSQEHTASTASQPSRNGDLAGNDTDDDVLYCKNKESVPLTR